MYYYIFNGLELTVCFLPAYIECPYMRVCYMTCAYYYFNSDLPFYYGEIKNNLLKSKR